MTPEERRLQLSTLRADLCAELAAIEERNAPLYAAYSNAVQNQTKLKNQLRELDNVLRWFQAHNDPEPPEEQADAPIPF